MGTNINFNTSSFNFDKQKLEKAADILKAVAHPLRLEIIQLLAVEQKLSVNQICEAISGEQSLVSHHLINMKLRGILLSQKIGKSVLYTIKEPEILNIIDCINKSALFKNINNSKIYFH